MRSDSIMSEEKICRACFTDIHVSPIRSFLEKDIFLCDDCLKKIDVHIHDRVHDGVHILFLSDYGGILKDWLFRYKEQLDVELAPCFLFLFHPIIRLYCRGSIIIPIPSSEEAVERRGFSHLELMLRSSGLRFQNILRKTTQIDQKEMKIIDRHRDDMIDLITPDAELLKKDVVLFDDVFTSGTTFRSSVTAMKRLQVNKVRGLILMDNHHLEERKLS